MVRYGHLSDAKKAVIQWGGDPESIVHLGDRGNSVFSFNNSSGNPQILRFTDPDFRSYNELVAEINFVDSLHVAGVAVAQSLPTRDGRSAFQTECSSGVLICSSIAYAPGIEIQEDSPHWNAVFFKEWGRNLGQIHEAAIKFKTQVGEPNRWQWDEEILIARAEQLIPQNDMKSREEFRHVLERCRSLPKSSSTFGLIHADHAPQNFRYEIDKNLITAFDFGNCCYHWFISDLAISLSTVRRKEKSEYIRESVLEGYSSIRTLPDNFDELIDLFIRLRVIYVYLSRLHLWSKNRTSEHQRDLNLFKDLVHDQRGWPKAK